VYSRIEQWSCLSTLDQTITAATYPRQSRPDALARFTRTRTGRWLIPSLCDLFFIALFIWLFVAGGDGWRGLLADGDIGWHIRTGDYILAHGSVPRRDLFSFTRTGAPWYAWEWLSDVLFALVHQAAGLKGVVFLAGVIIGLWPLVMLRQALWRGANAWIAVAVTLVGVGAGSMHFLARPHIFTIVFTTAAVWVIESDLRTPRQRTWWLIPMTVLWTNLHGGFLVLIVLLAMTALGLAAAACVDSSGWRAPVRYAGLTIGSAAASLINPYGIGLHAHIAEYLRSDWIRSVVQEFQAPNFRSENQLQYEALLIAGLMSAGLLLLRKRYIQLLWIVAFAHGSLASIRNVPIFVAVAAPVIAEVLSELWSGVQARFTPGSPLRILYDLGQELTPGFRRISVWLVVFVAGYWSLGSAGQWPRDFPKAGFPVGLIHANANVLAGGRVLTLDQWADYLIYEFYPRERVFVDGRSDFYGPELGRDYLRAAGGDSSWRNTLDRFHVDTVLAPASWPLTAVLKSESGWRLVASDGRAYLFTRRSLVEGR
jgi:hypothetical protein